MNWDQLKEYVDTLPDVGIPGCDLIVCRDHEVLFRHMAGFSDAEGKKPVDGNELYWFFSCT